MRVPKLAGGPDREIRVLGGAAPLSSQKIGYLLRVAHMIPIIFLHFCTPPTAPGGARSHWLGLSRQTHISMGTFNKNIEDQM